MADESITFAKRTRLRSVVRRGQRNFDDHAFAIIDSLGIKNLREIAGCQRGDKLKVLNRECVALAIGDKAELAE